jgi:hypothetical protein
MIDAAIDRVRDCNRLVRGGDPVTASQGLSRMDATLPSYRQHADDSALHFVRRRHHRAKCRGRRPTI